MFCFEYGFRIVVHAVPFQDRGTNDDRRPFGTHRQIRMDQVGQSACRVGRSTQSAPPEAATPIGLGVSCRWHVPRNAARPVRWHNAAVFSHAGTGFTGLGDC